MVVLISMVTVRSDMETGRFYCPNCRGDSNYVKLEASRWLAVWTYPVARFKVLGRYVKCLKCASEFSPMVAKLKRDHVEAILESWQCEVCRETNRPGLNACEKCKTKRPMIELPWHTGVR